MELSQNFVVKLEMFQQSVAVDSVGVWIPSKTRW